MRGQGLGPCISGLSLRAWALGLGAQESRAMRRWYRFLKVRKAQRKLNELEVGNETGTVKSGVWGNETYTHAVTNPECGVTMW